MKTYVYPCKPQFYHIKVGFKGVKIISACFRDETKFCSRYVNIRISVRTASTTICVFSKIRKIMYTPVNPSFPIYKWG